MQSVNENQNAKLTERLSETEVSDELRRQILPYADDKTLVVAGPNVAAVIGHRSEYGSSGGIGYYSQVRVFCGSQNEMQEWQWRDRYSASNDKPWLSVHNLGEIKVSVKGTKIIVEVELVNREHGKRATTFTFDALAATTLVRTLSAEEQTAFTTKVDREMDRVMTELDGLWKLKPTMVARYSGGGMMSLGTSGYVPYRRPSIKEREIRSEIGVAVFVTEEQIDHRMDDPQIRYELYVLTAKGEKAECKAEDHGYDRGDGGAFLKILEVKSDRIVINTKRGKSTISI